MWFSQEDLGRFRKSFLKTFPGVLWAFFGQIVICWLLSLWLLLMSRKFLHDLMVVNGGFHDQKRSSAREKNWGNARSPNSPTVKTFDMGQKPSWGGCFHPDSAIAVWV